MRTAVLLLTLALLATGCGADAGTLRQTAWGRAEQPIEPDGPVWAQRGVVHLGAAGTIRTSPRMDEYVVAGDGIYFVEREHPSSATPRLRHATAEGVADTGVEISGWGELRASPSGRYLAYIDRSTGPTDEFGTHLAAAIVVDTTTGREAVHTYAGMGDTGSDDLADLYEDATPPTIAGITDTQVWVAGPDGIRTYALPEGEQTDVYDGVDQWSKRRPWVFRYGSGPHGTWNLDRTWAIDADAKTGDLLHPAHGPDVTPRVEAPSWTLERWVDDDTVLGYAYDEERSPAGRGHRAANPITCEVPSGTCQRIPGAEGAIRLPRPSVG